MIYSKTTANGIPQEIPLTELPLFSKCPGCGAEVKTSTYEVMEFAEEDEDFDPDVCSVYCDHCQEEMNIIREQLSTMGIEGSIDTMPLNELKLLRDMTLSYFQCSGDE